MDVVRFEDSGLNFDDEERTPVNPGMKFLIESINFRPSEKFGEIAQINALTPDEDPAERCELKLYTTSKVLISQLHKISSKFSRNGDGILQTFVMVEVLEKEGENNNYMSFV